MRPRGAKRELNPYSELAHEPYFIDRVTLGSHTENGIETLRGSSSLRHTYPIERNQNDKQ